MKPIIRILETWQLCVNQSDAFISQSKQPADERQSNHDKLGDAWHPCFKPNSKSILFKDNIALASKYRHTTSTQRTISGGRNRRSTRPRVLRFSQIHLCIISVHIYWHINFNSTLRNAKQDPQITCTWPTFDKACLCPCNIFLHSVTSFLENENRV